MSDGRIVLRNYRLAFELERRIHRIDRYRIPLPYGLPLAALGYGTASLVVIVALGKVPLVGGMLGLLPLPVRLVFLPGVVAHALCRVGSDGRPMHEVLVAHVMFRARNRHRIGTDAVPRPPTLRGGMTFVPDERSPEYRTGVLLGPVDVTLQRPGRLRIGGRVAEVIPAPGDVLGQGQRVRVDDGRRLVLR